MQPTRTGLHIKTITHRVSIGAWCVPICLTLEKNELDTKLMTSGHQHLTARLTSCNQKSGAYGCRLEKVVFLWPISLKEAEKWLYSWQFIKKKVKRRKAVNFNSISNFDSVLMVCLPSLRAISTSGCCFFFHFFIYYL